MARPQQKNAREFLRKRFAELAVIPGGYTPADTEKWRKVIVTANVKVDAWGVMG